MCLSLEKREKAKTYRNSQRERLSSLLEYPGFYVAIYMDPRYVSLIKDQEDAKEKAKEFVVEVHQRLENLKGREEHVVNSVEQENIVVDLSSEDEDEFNKFLSEKNKEMAVERLNNTPNRSIINMLDEYLINLVPLYKKENVISYWESKKTLMPDLFDLAMTVLAIPATQCSVERDFSALKYCLNPLRYDLTNNIIDDVMRMHCNSELVGELSDELLFKQTNVQT